MTKIIENDDHRGKELVVRESRWAGEDDDDDDDDNDEETNKKCMKGNKSFSSTARIFRVCVCFFFLYFLLPFSVSFGHICINDFYAMNKGPPGSFSNHFPSFFNNKNCWTTKAWTYSGWVGQITRVWIRYGGDSSLKRLAIEIGYSFSFTLVIAYFLPWHSLACSLIQCRLCVYPRKIVFADVLERNLTWATKRERERVYAKLI